MKSRFWNLDPPDDERKLAEWDDSVVLGGPIYCSANPGHRRAGKRLTNLSVVLPRRDVPDFVWTWKSECLVQDRVLTVFREHGITGFEVRPASAHFRVRTEADPPRLWELVVTGWGGVAPEASGVRLLESKSCSVCGHLVYSGFDDPSRLIDESQWDGSDIFIVWPLPRFIFVTERVADVIRSYKLTGVVLQRQEDLRVRNLLGTLAPGRLSHHMPEARARELGEPLGIY